MPISDAAGSGVFVHVRRPDGTSRLVGRYRVLGASGGSRVGEFAYVGSWLRDEDDSAFPLDPQNLPLQRGPFAVRRRGLLPGALADATPDRWGRRLIEAARPGQTASMTAEDWLLATGDDRVGCLAFSPTPAAPGSADEPAGVSQLAEIADGFERLLRGEAASPLIERLFRAGHSLGGARPKTVVEEGGALWIAKFQTRGDDHDQCAAEHATMRLAGLCGIEVAQTRVVEAGPRKAVLVRRFDRTEGGVPYRPTVHFLSALSALGLDETDGGGSYAGIAAFIRRFCRDHARDREQLFRRMVFNVLCGNRDDHLKNHAFLRGGSGAWSLSPAFDIVPQPEMEDVQAIGIGRLGATATLWNCLSQCAEFGLGTEDAERIVGEVREVMTDWRDRFAAWGVDRHTIRRIEPAFSRVG